MEIQTLLSSEEEYEEETQKRTAEQESADLKELLDDVDLDMKDVMVGDDAEDALMGSNNPVQDKMLEALSCGPGMWDPFQ